MENQLLFSFRLCLEVTPSCLYVIQVLLIELPVKLVTHKEENVQYLLLGSLLKFHFFFNLTVYYEL